jgi:HEPN domain-containing protein
MNEDKPNEDTRARDKLATVRKWFAKADADICTAEFALGMDVAPYDIICFHTQQCAEKYLKGLLAFHDTDFPKTHIIEVLISMCSDLYPSMPP